MADDPEAVKPVPITGTPRDMRPRATPNAEINAQKGDEFRYQQGIFDRPTIGPAQTRGYAKGGLVCNDYRKSKVISCKNC